MARATCCVAAAARVADASDEAAAGAGRGDCTVGPAAAVGAAVAVAAAAGEGGDGGADAGASAGPQALRTSVLSRATASRRPRAGRPMVSFPGVHDWSTRATR